MRTLGDNIHKFGRLATRHRAAYPEEIQIEITNVCNLTCAMCPHTFGTIPTQHFPLSQFEALVRKNPPPKRLILTGWGEPLLHPDFFTLLRRARENWPTTQVRFTTNGVLLNPEIQSQLAEHPVAQITVSIDLWPGRTVAPAMQRVLHPSSPKIIRNLEQYALNAALRQTTPLVLQSLLVEENYEDVRQLIVFAGEQGIQAVNLVRLQPYPGIPLERPAWDREQAMITDL
ncbi:MAG: radical SAM protein [bacterium]|jgi:MoaA/NifB/PqqE/SkfB family radical SAM enzyme|nr:radical SAM protein [bacterium]